MTLEATPRHSKEWLDGRAAGSWFVSRPEPVEPLECLSGRELEVLALIAEGLSNQAIARRLFITERTVEAHIKQMFHKLGLSEDRDCHRRVLVVITYLRSVS